MKIYFTPSTIFIGLSKDNTSNEIETIATMKCVKKMRVDNLVLCRNKTKIIGSKNKYEQCINNHLLVISIDASCIQYASHSKHFVK